MHLLTLAGEVTVKLRVVPTPWHFSGWSKLVLHPWKQKEKKITSWFKTVESYLIEQILLHCNWYKNLSKNFTQASLFLWSTIFYKFVWMIQICILSWVYVHVTLRRHCKSWSTSLDRSAPNRVNRCAIPPINPTSCYKFRAYKQT